MFMVMTQSDEGDIKSSKYITDIILETIFQWESFPFHTSMKNNGCGTVLRNLVQHNVAYQSTTRCEYGMTAAGCIFKIPLGFLSSTALQANFSVHFFPTRFK